MLIQNNQKLPFNLFLWDSDCAHFFALTTSAKPHAPVHIASADSTDMTMPLVILGLNPPRLLHYT
jgi:hypothetical protein